MAISVRLTKESEKRLDNLAKLTGRTKSYYVRKAVEEKLEDLEDIYLAEQRIEEPEGPKWSLEELIAGDDLED